MCVCAHAGLKTALNMCTLFLFYIPVCECLYASTLSRFSLKGRNMKQQSRADVSAQQSPEPPGSL